MSSQVPESKNDRKISVEIKKSRASNLSCSKGILICKNWATIYANWALISGASEVNLDIMTKSSHNLLGSGHDFSVTESVSIKAKLVFGKGFEN